MWKWHEAKQPEKEKLETEAIVAKSIHDDAKTRPMDEDTLVANAANEKEENPKMAPTQF